MPVALAGINTMAIERLAARAILASLDEESAPLSPEVISRPIPTQHFQLSACPPGARALPPAAMIRKNAESIGCLYCIPSKWTKFVAVDQLTAAVSEGYLYNALADHATQVDPSNLFIRSQSTGGTSTVAEYCTSTATEDYLPPCCGSPSKKASGISASLISRRSIRPCSPSTSPPPRNHSNSYCWIRPKPPSLNIPTQAMGLDWQSIVACQTASGAFRLDDEMRKLLDQHFCLGARQWLRKRFHLDSRIKHLALWSELQPSSSSLPRAKEDTKALSQMTFDTAATVIYILSHFMPDSSLWKMMILKARGYISAQFGGSLKWLTYLFESIRHAHVGNMVLCTMCDRTSRYPAQKDTRTNIAYDKNSVKCSYPGCESVFEIQDPNGLKDKNRAGARIFDHQMRERHLYCAQATANAKGEQPREIVSAPCAPGTSKEPGTVMKNEVVNPLSQDVASSEKDRLQGES